MRALRQGCSGRRRVRVGAAVGVVALLGAALLTLTACSDGGSNNVIYSTETRSVTVTGNAEVMVDPDQVVISVGVQAEESGPALAKDKCDTLAQNVFEAASGHGVEDVDVQTEYVRVNPVYGYDSSFEERPGGERRVIVGYNATQTIAITLKDLTKYEDLITSLLDAGVEYVNNITFETSELRKYRDQARELAVQAAKEKAAALAGELDQSIGRPIQIVESQNIVTPWYGGTQLSNAMFEAAAGSLDNEATVAPGQVTVSADVTVSFELK